MKSTYTISPLDGITEAAKAIGAKVEYSAGASAFRYLPLINPAMKSARVEIFIETPVKSWYNDVAGDLPKADWEATVDSSDCFMIDGVKWEDLGDNPRTRVGVLPFCSSGRLLMQRSSSLLPSSRPTFRDRTSLESRVSAVQPSSSMESSSSTTSGTSRLESRYVSKLRFTDVAHTLVL